MTRVAALAAALGVALVLGASAPAKMEGRVFALNGTQAGQYVVELNPESLGVLPQRRVKIAPATSPYVWSHDPSRHFLAVTVGQRLKIVDLWSLRVVRTAKLGVDTRPAGVVWLRPDRIVVLQRFAADFEVVVFDASRLRVLSRSRISGGEVVDSAWTRDGLALLLGPQYTIGAARLLFVGADGGTRVVALERVSAGFNRDANDESIFTHVSPAVAYDAARDRVYVVAPNGIVAEVAREDVRYRTLHGTYAKIGSGESRDAFVVGNRLVVTGTVDTMVAGSEPVGTSRGIGIRLIDLSTWETTHVADSTSSLVRWRDALVATGGVWHSQRGHEGTGLAVYGLDGRERFRVLEGVRVWVSTVYRDRVYAYVSDERMAVVDLATATVTRPPTKALPWLLLEHASPVW